MRLRLVFQDQRVEMDPVPSEGEFSGGVGSLLVERAQGVLHVGLGDRAKVSAAGVRQALAAAFLWMRKVGVAVAVLDAGPWGEFVAVMVEGAILGNYRYEAFLPRKTEPVRELVVVVSAEMRSRVRADVERGCAVAESVNQVRELANTPGNLLYPEVLARTARKWAREWGMRCTVLEGERLAREGFGGMLAVGGGSAKGPCMIALEHRGGVRGERPLVLVGKAITFDSGGISIKPAAGMEEMIFDKCGGMAVLGAMVAVARLGLRRNVVGILAAAENMPSGSAYRPGDIVTTYTGVTVEVVNTDAEGRMVLADALGWARKRFDPAMMVDLATLTGACGVALGEHAAGLWSNSSEALAQVQQAALTAGERVWPMPLFEEYSTQIRSSVAQLKNSGGRLGGANTGAAFLKVFAGETPWAHMDIAYTSHRTKEEKGLAPGATGFGVRTLVHLAEAL
jgi:leucyl aminopeptidase